MTTRKTTDVAFAITFSSNPRWYTITFASNFPSIYINSTSLGIKINPYFANYVDIDENWQGRMVTVDYTKATAPSPAGLTRIQWIDAVRALFV